MPENKEISTQVNLALNIAFTINIAENDPDYARLFLSKEFEQFMDNTLGNLMFAALVQYISSRSPSTILTIPQPPKEEMH